MPITLPSARLSALLALVTFPILLTCCAPADEEPASGEQSLLANRTACATSPEYRSATLVCPRGLVVKSVTFASYGTPAGACGAFRLGSCHAPSSRSVVEKACLGRATCTIAASNAAFGDPCVGVDKRLAIQGSCGAPSGSVDAGVVDLRAPADLASPPPADLAPRPADLAAAPADLAVGAAPGPYFPPASAWYQDVSRAPLDAQSATVVGWLDGRGWGGGRMQIDFSIEVLKASAQVVPQAFQKTIDFFSPDCDADPVPVPPGGALEGESGYACERDGDCHLIVTQGTRLYEMWRADIRNGVFRGGCLAVWDMTRVYGPSGRGEGCTSADAAGYPIAPLLFSADEVAAGHIDHAIRFILPNSSIRGGSYLHPATHSTGAASGPGSAPPYGARLRLRASYPVDALPTAGARVVARAMQRYGILLSDGGTVALTAQSDRFTTHKWSGLLGPLDLAAIRPGDFEMIDGGARLPYPTDCVRNAK